MKPFIVFLTSCVMMVMLVVGIWIGHMDTYLTATKLVSECPAVNPPTQVTQVTQQNLVTMPKGWTCDAPRTLAEGGSTDLMQPSGYWNMDLVQCFKLITPISKWCAEHSGSDCSADQIAGKLDPK